MSDKLIKCTNGVRFRFVSEKLFNSPAFKRTDWRKVEEPIAPPEPEQKSKKNKAGKLSTREIESIVNEADEEFESLPDEDKPNFDNL